MSSEYELMDVDEPPSSENGLIGRKLTRGEKSKIAAKSRRDKENVAFLDLVAELPLSSDVLNKMDKASVIRLAICYIKLKHFVQKDILTNQYKDIPKETRSILHSLKSSATPDELDSEAAAKELKDVEGQMMLDALNGFLIFINKKHSIRFVSASITDYLGLNIENLIGKNVNEIIHPCDIAELAKQFMPDSLEGNSKKQKAITDKCCPNSTEDKSQKVFYLRMKYNMCKNGSKTKQTGYTLVQWSGKLKQHVSSKNNSLVTDGLVCICRPMQTSSVMEIRMDGNMFMSRHDLGMTFTFCDTRCILAKTGYVRDKMPKLMPEAYRVGVELHFRIVTLIGYEPSELVGKTAYHFHNPIDAPKVSDCHQNLIIKGASVSKYYRFLGKNDNWVWLQTRATIIYNTANQPQYIVCMNYVISEEEGERYLMLEEHKHANTQTDNAVVTLPDNHHPTLLFHTKATSTPGPTIVELEDKNLERTACLNGELDSPRVTHTVRLVENKPVQNERLDTLLEYQKQSQCNSFPQAIQQQVCPLVSQGSLLLQQCGAPEDGGIQTNPASNFGSSCTSIPTTQSTYPNDGNQLSNMIRDVSCLDNSFSIFPESCQSNYSHSDDGGYESASSPSSSHRSPQVVSPYSADMGSERAYTEMMSECEVALRTDGNSAIIKNCDFGVGYPFDYEQMSSTEVFTEQKSSDMQDAENILDELLQSFNQPTSNLDDNIAVVFSTIESLTQQSCQTFSSMVKSPNIVSEGKQVLGSIGSVKDNNQKSDKSVLRHILTIPEDKIPKQPVSLVQSPSNCSMFANQTPSTCRENKRCVSMRNTSNKPPFPIKKSGERLIDSMIQKSLVDKSTERELSGQKNLCHDQTRAQNEPLPDDISDFALQYMEAMMNSESEASLSEYTELSPDFLMDTSDNSDLTKEFSTGTEHQCGSNFSNSQPKFRSMNGNALYQYSNGHNKTLKENNTKLMQQRYSLSSYGNEPMSSHDHGYVQKNSRSQRPSNSMKMCNNNVGCRPVSSSNTQSQTSNQPISELEKHLRAVDQANSMAATVGKNPCGESSLLQQLLTGELSKDRYIQMEKDRCPRRQGLKPN